MILTAPLLLCLCLLWRMSTLARACWLEAHDTAVMIAIVDISRKIVVEKPAHKRRSHACTSQFTQRSIVCHV